MGLSVNRRDTEQMGTLGSHLVMGLALDLLLVSQKIRKKILKERRKKVAPEESKRLTEQRVSCSTGSRQG
jgi:hypothetical protein